jgi:hypothetical protein
MTNRVFELIEVPYNKYPEILPKPLLGFGTLFANVSCMRRDASLPCRKGVLSWYDL